MGVFEWETKSERINLAAGDESACEPNGDDVARRWNHGVEKPGSGFSAGLVSRCATHHEDAVEETQENLRGALRLHGWVSRGGPRAIG
jgi:hypothetical protein